MGLFNSVFSRKQVGQQPPSWAARSPAPYSKPGMPGYGFTTPATKPGQAVTTVNGVSTATMDRGFAPPGIPPRPVAQVDPIPPDFAAFRRPDQMAIQNRMMAAQQRLQQMPQLARWRFPQGR